MSSLNNHRPTETPVPLPRFPGFTYRALNRPQATTPDRDAPPGQASHRPSGPSTPKGPKSPVKSSKSTPGIAVMLRSPATPMQYEVIDEPEDELHTADAVVLSDLSPQYQNRVAAAREAAAARERQNKVPLTRPPLPATITPVPPPKTVAMPQASKAEQGSGISGPGKPKSMGRPKGWKPGMSYAEVRRLGPEAAAASRVSTPEQPSGTSTPDTKPASLGRPKGWKPGMSYADVRNLGPEAAALKAGIDPSKVREKTRVRRAAAPAPGTQAIRKRKGRPPRPPSPSPRAIYEGLGFKFVPFLCEWRGCSAELHNLETLGRHVRVVHCGRGQDECLWGGCAEGSPVWFGSAGELEGHVEKAHLVPFAWHVGDGPKVSLPGTPGAEEDGELPGYLFDAEGRQVTPSIRDQQVEDLAASKARKMKLKAWLREMWEAMPYEGENEGEEEGERRVPALSVAV